MSGKQYSAHSGVRLAVNLSDLDRLEVDPVRRKLLGGRLDLQSPIQPDRDIIIVSGVRCGDPEETAVPFLCELLMAAGIVDMVRARDAQEGDSPTRVYICRQKKGSWERLSGNTTLTEKVRGKVRLSSKVFPTAVSVSTIPSGISGSGL